MPRVRTHNTPATTPAKPVTPPKDAGKAKGTAAAGTATGTKDTFATGPVPPPPPKTGKATPLDAGAKVFLSASGELLSSASQRGAKTAVEQGETIFRASQASQARNLFADPAVTLDQKAGALLSLTAAFNGANPANGLPTGFKTKDQALQTRASAAPLILDVAKSLDPAKPAEKALQQKAMAAYLKLVEAEPHGLARTFMIYDLQRAKPTLPTEFRAPIDELMNEVAPLTPPYEQWFKDGNKALNVDYYVGEGFWDDEVATYVNQGFAKTENADGTVTLKKKMEVDAPLGDGTPRKYETEVVMTMHNGPGDMFQKMGDEKVGIVVYSGHANYGREVPSHLADGAEMKGSKLFFALQCGGKGVHNALLEKYPDLQVVASKNSSYAYADHATFLNALDGISSRSPWVRIAERNTSDNYYFPTDTMIARRTQDLDHDGRVDEWDRVVSYDTFHPQADLDRQLTAMDPKKPADELDGRAIHGAILRFHRMAGYSEWCEGLKDQGVLNDGYYEGKPTDPLVKLEEVKGADGAAVYKLKVNKCYAHATEETLGAAVHYELGRTFAQKQGLSEADAKAAGLLMAAEALNVDTGYQEEAAFAALLGYAKLPATIGFHDAMGANETNETYSAGCSSTLALFKETLQKKGIAIQ